MRVTEFKLQYSIYYNDDQNLLFNDTCKVTKKLECRCHHPQYRYFEWTVIFVYSFQQILSRQFIISIKISIKYGML